MVFQVVEFCENMTEREAYIAFSVFPGIGPMRFKLLTEYFGSAKAAWEATAGEFQKINLGEKLTQKFSEFRKTFDIDDYMKQLSYHHVNTLLWSEEKYPKLLKEISDAPFLLYVKSKPLMERIDMERTIAVVGTRKATPYGRDVTRRITEELVDAGFTIVSGMAYGIDAVAHETAIALGGKTIAVLGCGVDIIAPPTNVGIYKKLTEEGYGAVISEMPLGMRPSKGLFPARNRIISGLSWGVLVTEGANDSGALITARYAGDQGRDVFAVPGPITSPYSRGPTFLLKNGAVLVESARDIMDALGIKNQQKKSKREDAALTNVEEKRIMACLTGGGKHIDEIVRMSKLSTPTVFSTLTVLEMKGIIKDIGGKVYEIQ
jgi:DNA processing protein